MPFEFVTAGRILFGSGVISKLGEEAHSFGGRAFLVTGRSSERSEAILQQLTSNGHEVTRYEVQGEPDLDRVLDALAQARQAGCDLVIGCGGGSVIDAGKAVAAWMTNQDDPLRYLEVIGEGKPLDSPSLPYIAIPTTAGTGAEATKNAVIGIPSHRTKVSLRGKFMLPRLAIVDPELTLTLPKYVTARTGMDALTQLIEPYVCNNPNPLVDALCLEGIRRVGKSLLRAYNTGDDLEARVDMCLASLLSGMALANARLGAAHGFAAPLGGMFGAPHGEICARLLAPVMEVNYQAMHEQGASPSHVQRFDAVAQALLAQPGAGVREAITWVERACDAMGIARLAAFGVSRADFPVLVKKAQKSSSIKGNPARLETRHLELILEKAL